MFQIKLVVKKISLYEASKREDRVPAFLAHRNKAKLISNYYTIKTML